MVLSRLHVTRGTRSMPPASTPGPLVFARLWIGRRVLDLRSCASRQATCVWPVHGKCSTSGSSGSIKFGAGRWEEGEAPILRRRRRRCASWIEYRMPTRYKRKPCLGWRFRRSQSLCPGPTWRRWALAGSQLAPSLPVARQDHRIAMAEGRRGLAQAPTTSPAPPTLTIRAQLGGGEHTRMGGCSVWGGGPELLREPTGSQAVCQAGPSPSFPPQQLKKVPALSSSRRTQPLDIGLGRS